MLINKYFFFQKLRYTLKKFKIIYFKRTNTKFAFFVCVNKENKFLWSFLIAIGLGSESASRNYDCFRECEVFQGQ